MRNTKERKLLKLKTLSKIKRWKKTENKNHNKNNSKSKKKIQ